MTRFITGDDLGNLKYLRYAPSTTEGAKASLEPVSITDAGSEKYGSIQRLSLHSGLLTAAYANGNVCSYSLDEDAGENTVKIHEEWKEKRMKSGQKFVGLSTSQAGTYSCTSNGALRLHSAKSETQTTALPMRLRDWKLSPDTKAFAYGGDEVELSLWDVERAFSPAPPENADETTKKRKRADQLLPGEMWRAKNVPPDSLGLRQPVRISSLSFENSFSHHIIVGTELGNVRRYDTRHGRKPVADWSKITQGKGVQTVQSGYSEHEAFVSDTSNALYTIDLRNGHVLYKYKGIAGSINSVAPSPTCVASTSLDRFVRIHSTADLPSEAGKPTHDGKGEVLEKLYATSTPTVIIWDGDIPIAEPTEEEEDDQVWEGMKPVDDDKGDVTKRRRH